MNRIDRIFSELRAKKRGALMPFITAGYPTLETTKAIIPKLASAGASIIEVGIPFSDPIADGPVIAASMHEALTRGITPAQVFDVIRELRPQVDIGLVAMLSVSIVDRLGADAFVKQAAEAGFDGLIVPDIDTVGGKNGPAGELSRECAEHDLSFSLLIAPTTRPERLRELCALCRGFVYVLARVGITGEQSAAPQIASRVRELRAVTDLPLAVGFGISKPEHVAAVVEHADAAIVGSALVRRMGEADDAAQAGEQLVRELAHGLVPSPLGRGLG